MVQVHSPAGPEAGSWQPPGARVEPPRQFSRQGQVKHLASLVCVGSHFGDEFQVGDALADRHPMLVCIHDRGEPLSVFLTGRGLAKQVVIASEEKSVQFEGTIQQSGIFELACSIGLGGQDVNATRC